MQQTESSPKYYLRFAWLVWGLSAAFYFSDYLARVAPSVMHQQLQMDFGMNEAGFGILAASFYLPYVLMQIPVGLAVDRISIRGLLTTMSVLTAFGCVIFGMSDNLLTGSLARMIIGFSAAFAFVCTLRLATSWFPPAMLGLLAGLTQALGMLGAAAGAAPIAYMVNLVGWRESMYVIAGLFVALAILLYCFVKDKPDSYKKTIQYTQSFTILHSLKIILSNRQTWINAFYAGFLFCPTAVIGEALGPAFLQYGQGLSAQQAAFATGLIFIGWGISGPISGYISDKMGRRKPIMILSALCGIVLSSIFVFYPHMSAGYAYLIFLVFGFTNTGVAIAYAVSAEIHDRNVIGTSIAFTNMISIFVGALFQPIVGWMIDKTAGEKTLNVANLHLTDFQAGLWILPIASFIALILSLLVKETWCHTQPPHK